jgi:hypothetical protein
LGWLTCLPKVGDRGPRIDNDIGVAGRAAQEHDVDEVVRFPRPVVLYTMGSSPHPSHALCLIGASLKAFLSELASRGAIGDQVRVGREEYAESLQNEKLSLVLRVLVGFGQLLSVN